MSDNSTIVLVNLQNNEKHCINTLNSVIGRGWLNCNDKRISRCHGIFKFNSPNSITLIATHQNLMFFRRKNNAEVNQIGQNTEVNLFVGDSFGLLIDEFWFSIQPFDTIKNSSTCLNGNVTEVEQNESITSGPKRKTNVDDSEPDSTNKRIKTEPIEYQENDDPNSTNRINDTMPMPSTSVASSSPMNISVNGENVEENVNQVIKTEPSDSTEGQTNSAVQIKTEENNEVTHADTSTIALIPFQIKTEIKNEPVDNQSVASGSGTVQRSCCRYGIRCYRQNPTHRCDEAHPGDSDYRLPDYPDPPLGVPSCPFLDRCYRRNPLHFQQFSHKITRQNGKVSTNRTQTNKMTKTTIANNAYETDESEDDPYATDDDQDIDYCETSESERE